MDLNFKVKEQIINRTDNNTIVNLSENYLQLCFTFQSNDWTGLTKFVLFKHGEKSTRIGLIEDKVIVPASLLTGNRLVFSLYGLDTPNDEVYRITTNQIRLHLLDSGYTSEVDDLIDDEEVDIVEEIYIAINNTETVCKEYTDTGLESKADIEHTHTKSDVTDFTHTHTESEITDLGNYSTVGHTHTEEDITDLGDYSVVGHTHTKSEITDFSHTHTLSDITDNDKYSLFLEDYYNRAKVIVLKNGEEDKHAEFTIRAISLSNADDDTLQWDGEEEAYVGQYEFSTGRVIAYCEDLDQYSNMIWIGAL